MPCGDAVDGGGRCLGHADDDSTIRSSDRVERRGEYVVAMECWRRRAWTVAGGGRPLCG